MVCTADGNPQPTLYWTTSLLDNGTSRTFTGTKLTVDVCNLTSWSQRSDKRKVSGTVRLILTCHAQNTVRGQTRASSVQKFYDLALLKNMDEVCGKFIRQFCAYTSFTVTPCCLQVSFKTRVCKTN